MDVTLLNDIKKNQQSTIIKETRNRAYQDTNSPAFSKSANTVHAVLANKFPKLHFTNRFVKDTLNELSTTYSRTRLVNKNKHFFGTSFYSPHPHHRWHVDLQDMSIFRKSNLSTMYNFMLVCVDDFSNYIMIKLLRDKKAKLYIQQWLTLSKKLVLYQQLYIVTREVNLTIDCSTIQKQTFLKYNLWSTDEKLSTQNAP